MQDFIGLFGGLQYPSAFCLVIWFVC